MTAAQTTPARDTRVPALRRTLDYLGAFLPRRRDYASLGTSWRVDGVAGVTVGIVALPLALGFGISSGVGAEAGLITAIVAGLIAAVFGGSHVQVSGPTGAMVVVLAPIVASHGVGAVAAVALLGGLIVAAAGLLKLGRVVSFIPWPVIEGFTVGIALIIFLQQVPALTRPDAGGPAHTNVAVEAITRLLHADSIYLLWSLGAVAVVAASMLLLPRLHRAIPGSLVGVAVASVAALLLGAPLATIGELPASLPMPALPSLDVATFTELAPAAFAVAALAAIESLLSARVAASLSATGRYDPDRELFGQGLASIGASLFGGMPATGAIARTAVNVRSGARTRVAAAMHAVFLLLIVALLAVPVSHIPLAALSGVLMVTAAQMVNRRVVSSIIRSTRGDALAFGITAVVTVSVDLIVAVGIGVVVAGAIALRGISQATGVHHEALPGSPQPGDERIALIAIDGPLFFASAERVLDELLAMEALSAVVLRLSRMGIVDATGAHALETLVQQLERRGITVIIKGVQERHQRLFDRVGVIDALGHAEHLHSELGPAVAHARSHIAREATRDRPAHR